MPPDDDTEAAEASGARNGSMRAIVRDAYGEAAEVLRLERIARPVVGADDVLVRVEAAGVDRGAWHLITGLPYPVRLAGYGFRAPKNRVAGSEVAGRVEAVGEGVTDMRVGDAVFGIAEGSFAEFARAQAAKLAPKPESISFEQAASLPVSALAALQAVRDHGSVERGQRVLVIGASGGVGSLAVQIARSLGAKVTGVASGEKLDLVRAIGADHVIDYTRENLAEVGDRYDVIVDTGGNRGLGELRRLLTPNGRLVIVGGETGGRWLGGTDRQLRAIALTSFVRQKLGTFISSENRDDLIAIKELVDAGRLAPALDRTFPLAEAAAAVDYVNDGRARGKVALAVYSSANSGGSAFGPSG